MKLVPWYNGNEFRTMAAMQQHSTTPCTTKQNGVIEQ